MQRSTKKRRLIWRLTICIVCIAGVLTYSLLAPQWRPLHDYHARDFKVVKETSTSMTVSVGHTLHEQHSLPQGARMSVMSKAFFFRWGLLPGFGRLAHEVVCDPEVFTIRLNDWEVQIAGDFQGRIHSTQANWPDSCPDVAYILPDGRFVHWRGPVVEVDGKTITLDKPGTYHVDAAGNVTFDPEAVPYWDPARYAPPSGGKW